MIIRLIITVIIIYGIIRLAKGMFPPSASGDRRDRFPRSPASLGGEELVKDPYCGTYVPVSSADKVIIDGKELYFCSRECAERYKEQVKK
jgi:YHS domain-containing protein